MTDHAPRRRGGARFAGDLGIGGCTLRHVALLIETSRAFGRGLLRGVARFKQEHPQWLTYLRPHGLGDPPPAWLKGWRGDGVLARIENRRTSEVIASLGIPVVNLRGTTSSLPFPFVSVDDAAIAELAARHLLDRGFRHFGFSGYRRGYHRYLDMRADTFQETVTAAGCTCDICASFEPSHGKQERSSWEREEVFLADWISSLPKPVGIMTCNDDRGMQVLEACRRVGASVPDEVAVIGVDNDECLCSLSIPPLSSIDVNPEQVGYQAAALLEQLMAKKRRPPKEKVSIPPRGVVARQSTDAMAIKDQEVASAIRFIREHACEGIRVGDVLVEAGASRASLESRLKQLIGRTVHQEIQRVRIDRVQTLLANTNLPIKQIAFQTGFRTVQYMTRAFRAARGYTPASYRRTTQP